MGFYPSSETVSETVMLKINHLCVSRHGVFYLRVYHQGKSQKFSLRTKDPTRARIIALTFNLKKHMAIQSASSKPDLSDLNIDIDNIKQWKEKTHSDGTVEVETTSSADAAEYRAYRKEERDHEIALKLLEQENLKIEAAERAMRETRTQTEQNIITKILNQPSPVPTELPLLSAMIDAYIDEEITDQTIKSRRNKRSQFHHFMKFAGDRRVNKFEDQDVMAYRKHLQATQIQKKTINKKIGALTELFRTAQGWNQRIEFYNPFEGKLFPKVEKEVSYLAFNSEQIDQIFSKETYCNFNKLKPNYYWLPFLALYTGARLEELASLEIKNIKQEDGIWYFDIPRMKNDNSERKVPLHKEIINSGFLDYVETVRTRNEQLLFPELKKEPKYDAKTGELIPPSNYGKNPSRRFGEYMDSINLSDPQLVFHSFRHTFISSISTTSNNIILNMALVGHIDANILTAIGVSRKIVESAHAENYQHQKPLKVLKAAIDEFDFKLKVPFAFGLYGNRRS